MESVCAYVQKNGPQDSSFRQPATPCILQIVHSVEEAPAQALDIQLLIDVVARGFQTRCILAPCYLCWRLRGRKDEPMPDPTDGCFVQHHFLEVPWLSGSIVAPESLKLVVTQRLLEGWDDLRSI